MLRKGDGYVVEYRCSICDSYVTIFITKKEGDELKSGNPYNSVFTKEKRKSLTHFEKGLCVLHSKQE